MPHQGHRSPLLKGVPDKRVPPAQAKDKLLERIKELEAELADLKTKGVGNDPSTS